MEEATYLVPDGGTKNQRGIEGFFRINQNGASVDIKRLENNWKEKAKEKEKPFQWAKVWKLKPLALSKK